MQIPLSALQHIIIQQIQVFTIKHECPGFKFNL